jgi:hypothetical protein
MTKKPLPLSDEDDETLIKRVETVARHQGIPSLTPSARTEQPRQPKPMKALKLIVPEYLFRELTVNAAQNGVTKKYLILKALQDAGYRIDPEDLEEDGRRVR